LRKIDNDDIIKYIFMKVRKKMKNKVVLITGASKGIGRNIAKSLAIEGYTIIANYNNSEKLAMELKEELKKDEIDIEIFKADVSKKEESQRLVNYCLEKYGKIDILVNNAGIAQSKLFTDITYEEFDNIMKTNVYSAFFITQEVARNMINNKSGCIINISSIWGLVGASCEVHYSMTKAAIDGMTKSLAKELGLSNIRVNSVAPGCIQTDMTKNLSEEDWKGILEESALYKKGKPEDITRCVKWLIEDEFTTGQVISPNGGLVI
jgi:3-oxoacyl-[acyl-carrier protein] reductase